MNINLSSSNKKQKKSLGFGLNQRSSGSSSTAKKKKKKGGNVLLDDDDDSEQEIDETAPSTNHRDAVNREIAAEQAALRKRADLALRQADRQVYDYDGAYESMQETKEQQKATAAAAQDSDSKKSRYIQDLLKQSEKRALEREAIHERKVAREQAEEDAQADYQGKEKFVTKAYKRKLEERQRMAEEDKMQQQRDEREDVTKKTGGAAFANFYGNIHRNVAMGAGSGGAGDSSNNSKGDKGDAKENTKATTTNTELPSKLGFMDGFERAGDEDAAETNKDPTQQNKDTESSKVKLPVDPEAKNRIMRKAREEKLAQARIRYFQRKGMMPVESTA